MLHECKFMWNWVGIWLGYVESVQSTREQIEFVLLKYYVVGGTKLNENK